MATENILRDEVSLELEYLKWLGSKLFICPFIGRTRLQMTGYYLICGLILCTAIQLLLTMFSAGSENWLEIINIAPNLGVIVMAYIKYTCIHTNRELYEEVFCHFKDDMWNIVSTQSKEHQTIVKKYKKIIMILSRFLLYYCIPLSLIVDSFPYLFMTYENKVHGEPGDYLYPFDAWYPFDKIKWYAFAYVWESFMTALVISLFLFSNIMNGSYIGFICMELRILGNCLEEIITPSDVKSICEGYNIEIHQTVARKLKIIIAKHNFLTKISSKLNEILGDAMLLNYSLGAVFICLTAFTFTVIDVTYKRIRYFLMFMSLLLEIFVQCIFGQVLSDHNNLLVTCVIILLTELHISVQSENITQSIYFSDWSYASPEVKKLLLMLIMKTQKQFQLTGKGYIVMNMNSFGSVCSSSYQFYNLLRTVYQ